MKKYFFISFFIISIILFFIYASNKNNNITYYSNYTAEKTSIAEKNYTNQIIADKSSSNDSSGNDNSSKKNLSKSTTISKFSTNLPRDTKARYSNIDLACDTLDGTIIESGKTFSLWNTLGCPTKQKGYRKAKAFTSTGKIRYSYGGGICQVSTTIYNALLKVKEIKIIERHEHSKDVVYIKDGKDAAVSFKSADLKFKNNLNYSIKLRAKVKNNKVVIKIENL